MSIVNDRPDNHRFWMYPTIEEAMSGLETAAMDTRADHGEAAVEEAWHDLVYAIADGCPPKVAEELIRRNL